MHNLRWNLAACAYWLWLKLLPPGPWKDDYLRAVTGLRSKYPKRNP